MKQFNAYTITEEDYKILDNFLKINQNIKRILEFGPGMSTYCFMENRCVVDSFECDINFYKKQKEEFKQFINDGRLTINTFANTSYIDLYKFDNIKYDLIFVDAPCGTKVFSRLNTINYALEHSKYVLVHDLHRQAEKDSLKLLSQNHVFTINNLNDKLGLLINDNK